LVLCSFHRFQINIRAPPELDTADQKKYRSMLTDDYVDRDTGTLKHLPAIPEWSDFDDCHGNSFAFPLE